MGTAPASAREALDMVRAGLGYLAAADATRLSAATQAECLRELEQAGAVATAARAAVLAAFTAGQGYAGDAEYSAVSWLIHRTGITRGAAVGHAAWAGRTRTHPAVVAALAAGQVPEPAGRLICLWTNRLPEKFREESGEVLLAAAAAGLGVAELAALVAQMYERARGDLPDEDPDAGFRDRGLKLATTFGGAGVIHGDLTPECAEVVGRVLDALAAPAGKEDDRTKDQRYHDALAEAMRPLCFCVMLDSWTTSRQTGRRPSSGQASTPVSARPTTRPSRSPPRSSGAPATRGGAAGLSRPPSRMTASRGSRKSPGTGSAS